MGSLPLPAEDLLDLVDECLFLVDSNAVVSYCNQPAKHLLRGSFTETPDCSLFDALPGTRGTPFEKLLLRSLSATEPASFAASLPGPILEGACAVRTFPLSQGFAVFIHTLAASSHTLESRNEMLTELADAAPAALCWYAVSPSGVGAFSYVSAGAEALLEASVQEILRCPDMLWNAIHPAHIEAVRSAMNAPRLALQPWRQAVRIITLRSRHIKWVNLSALPQHTENGGVAWRLILIDISDQKCADSRHF